MKSLKISAIDEDGIEIFSKVFKESKLMNISIMDYATAVLEVKKNKHLEYFQNSINKEEAYKVITLHDKL
jgi:hypothetical protein